MADRIPTSNRLRTTLLRCLVGTVIAITVAIDRAGVGLLVALFVLVVPFEKRFPRYRGQRVRRPGLGTDVAFALATPLLSLLSIISALIVGGASLTWLPGLALRPVVAQIPLALLPFIGVLLFDLVGYWSHRLAHEVPLLWRFHSVHHSAEQLDWVSGIRVHPLDGVLLGPPVLFLLAAGFPGKTTGVIALTQTLAGLFLHANVRWKLRWLHRVVATPDFHHWHHANEPEAIHTNYAAFLPLWDSLFGTFRIPGDRQPARYGVDAAMPTSLLGLLRYPFTGLTNRHSA